MKTITLKYELPKKMYKQVISMVDPYKTTVDDVMKILESKLKQQPNSKQYNLLMEELKLIKDKNATDKN
jgi:hypothetical protein